MQTAELVALPLAERLQAMEALWDSLCREAGAELTPAWHADELERRAAALDQGKEASSSWSEAKQRLRDAVAAKAGKA